MKIGKFMNGTSYKTTVANPYGEYDFYFYTMEDANREFEFVSKHANKGAVLTITNDDGEIVNQYAA